MIEDKTELQAEIDHDSGLKKQRTVLVVISLILLSLQFSGAKIIEANTFILKIAFEHQKGAPTLLVIGVMFLLLRYHNYAAKYHDLLNKKWISKLLKHPKINQRPFEADEPEGLLHECHPNGFNMFTLMHDQHASYSFDYRRVFPFRRHFNYEWSDDRHEYQSEESVNIRKKLGWRKYLEILSLEFKLRFLEYVKHREFLDINTPYIIGSLSIISYFFDDYLAKILA